MNKLEYTALGQTLYHCVLPNGLNIYVDERPEYGKQFAFFATRYGGMDLRFRGEDGEWMDTPAGVAHFLEHKMFDTQDGNALQLMDIVGVDDTMLEDLHDRDNALRLHTLLRECLSSREAEIIRLRYGLGGTVPLTQREIASSFGISRSYVSRIEKRALEKLRCALQAPSPPPASPARPGSFRRPSPPLRPGQNQYPAAGPGHRSRCPL